MKKEIEKLQKGLEENKKSLNDITKDIIKLEKDIGKASSKQIGILRHIQNKFKKYKEEFKTRIKFYEETLNVLK